MEAKLNEERNIIKAYKTLKRSKRESARAGDASKAKCSFGSAVWQRRRLPAGLSRLLLSLYLHNPRALWSTLGNCLTLRLKGTALSSALYRYLALLQHNAFQWQTISGAGLSNPVGSKFAIHSSGAYAHVLIRCVRTCVMMKTLLCSFVSSVSKGVVLHYGTEGVLCHKESAW